MSERTGIYLSDEDRDRLRSEAIAAGFQGLEATAAKNEEKIRALVPIALLLAERYNDVTVSEVRWVADELDLIGADENLSYLGAVMKRAGLVNTGRTRRSFIPVTHAIRQTVWRHPDGGQRSML